MDQDRLRVLAIDETAGAARRAARGQPIPAKIGDASPIKHVIYFVKENRT